MKNKKYYDVIIVGGGPAGSTAAYQLNKLGYEVLLLDKKEFPRRKLCGGLMTQKTLNLLMDIFDFKLTDLKDEEIIDYTSDSYRIYYKDKLITANNLKKKFNFVKRIEFDNYLINLAEQSGVKVIAGVKVTDINFATNTVKTDVGKEYNSRYIIGADGANSIIRNKIINEINISKNDYFKKNQAMTLETEVPREMLDQNIVEPNLYFGIINWGYGWLFPKSDTITIGLGGLKNKNEDFRDIFDNFLKILNLQNHPHNIKGWPIPFGNFMKAPIYKNTFLVGDAANLVDPLTGEGIYYAHKSAQIAAEVIDNKEKENIDHITEYKKKINNEIITNLYKSKFYRTLLWSTPEFLQNIFVRIGSKYFHRRITMMIQGYR